MTDERPEWQRWTEAARILARDSGARVLCPRNQDGFLETTDVGSDRRRERYLRCPRCGAVNVIRNPAGP